MIFFLAHRPGENILFQMTRPQIELFSYFIFPSVTSFVLCVFVRR